MQREVDQKELAGVVTLLARHGKVVEKRVYGKKDIASGAPMTADNMSDPRLTCEFRAELPRYSRTRSPLSDTTVTRRQGARKAPECSLLKPLIRGQQSAKLSRYFPAASDHA